MQLSDVSLVSSGGYVGLRIFPQQSTDAPFHIGLLIDTSGSMSERGRIETVRTTLQLLVAHMREEDALSLISYNHEASVLCSRESNKERILACVASLEAKGGTNFEAAFLALRGIPVDAIFVLTDGQVNQGLITLAGLRHLAARCFPRIPMHTLGYGADHNAELLRGLSVGSRASYTFAESDEVIPATVGGIVGALRDQVGDCEVVWEGDAECMEVGAETQAYWIGPICTQKEQWVVWDGHPTNLHIRWRGGELTLPEAREGDAVIPHIFRTKSIALFDRLRSNPHAVRKEDLDDLEQQILRSGAESHPLLLRIQAEIAEMREYLEKPRLVHLTRLTSNMQQMTVQRGADFASPTQRIVSASMVHEFTGISDDPVET